MALPTAPLRTYQLSGRVLNDAGVPVGNARVTYFFEPTSISIAASQAMAFTDSAGRYAIAFTARLGGLDEKGDTASAFTVAQVSASGYEDDVHYLFPPSGAESANFLMYPIQTITAGDSVSMTLRASDPVCVMSDYFPISFHRQPDCRTVHVATPSNGTLLISLVDADDHSVGFFALDEGDGFAVYSGGGQLSFRAIAGSTYTIRLISPINASDTKVVLRSNLARD